MLKIRGTTMNSTLRKKQEKNNQLETNNRNEMTFNDYDFAKLEGKLITDIEQAKTLLVHFDHIQGESEYDREQIFSNLLKAAAYFGLNLEKVDFHKQD